MQARYRAHRSQYRKKLMYLTWYGAMLAWARHMACVAYGLGAVCDFMRCAAQGQRIAPHMMRFTKYKKDRKHERKW